MSRILLVLLLFTSVAWGQTVFTLFDVKEFGTPATVDLTFVVGADTIRGGYGPTGQFLVIKAVGSGAGGANSGYIASLPRVEYVLAKLFRPGPGSETDPLTTAEPPGETDLFRGQGSGGTRLFRQDVPDSSDLFKLE